MYTPYSIFYIYIIVLIIQGFIFWKTYLNPVDKLVDIRLKDSSYATSILHERVDMLKNMSVQEWQSYNNRHTLNAPYSLVVYEYIKDKTFICRVHPKPQYVGLDSKTVTSIDLFQHRTLYLDEQGDKPIQNLYYTPELTYLWHDPDTHELVQKQSYSISIDQDDFQGYVAVEYTSPHVLQNAHKYYYNSVSKPALVFISIVITLTMYYSYVYDKSKRIHVPILYLLIFNGVLTEFLCRVDSYNNYKEEMEKATLVDRSIGASGLIAVTSVYLLGMLIARKNKYTDIIQSLSLFILSMLFFLLSLESGISIVTTSDLRTQYISKCLYFNLSCVASTLLFLNFLNSYIQIL